MPILNVIRLFSSEKSPNFTAVCVVGSKFLTQPYKRQ